jgi:hypothetical protein
MYVSEASKSASVILINFPDSHSWRESSSLGKQLDKYFPIREPKDKEPTPNPIASVSA